MYINPSFNPDQIDLDQVDTSAGEYILTFPPPLRGGKEIQPREENSRKNVHSKGKKEKGRKKDKKGRKTL